MLLDAAVGSQLMAQQFAVKQAEPSSQERHNLLPAVQKLLSASVSRCCAFCCKIAAPDKKPPKT
jgi:hypothetical protein